MMKSYPVPLVSALLLACVGLTDATAEQHVIAVGLRHHVEHTVFEDLPYDDADVGYALAYEYHEDAAYWQLAVEYASEVDGINPATGTNSVNEIITPQVNLILKDQYWRGGGGILWSHIDDDLAGADWLGSYGQLMFGITLPIAKMELDALAFYVFDWSDFAEFDTEDIEFGLWLKLPW